MTFHEGELNVQQRAGETQIAGRNGKIIANRLLPGAIPFIAQQGMLFIGTRDSQGSMWASILSGQPGFARAEDARTVVLDLNRMFVDVEDPFWANIEHDASAGMLLIDLATRKRYRINGELRREGGHLRLVVAEAYPNCPKYISRRIPAASGDTAPSTSRNEFISATDVLFIASSHPVRGADVSHRGGAPGFIKVLDDHRLLIPDYPGNGMFNTLGNLQVNPNAGLLIPDFSTGQALQLSGKAEILWDRPDQSGETGGTDRYWTFTIERSRAFTLPKEVRSEFLDYSPYNPPTDPGPL